MDLAQLYNANMARWRTDLHPNPVINAAVAAPTYINTTNSGKAQAFPIPWWLVVGSTLGLIISLVLILLWKKQQQAEKPTVKKNKT